MACLDFEKTFIQAIVYNYDVLKEYGAEAEVKSAGKILTKGKDYEMVSFVMMSGSIKLTSSRLMVISCLSRLELQKLELFPSTANVI